MSENINELASALSKTQKELTNVSKDAENPYFKSHYATLANCWDSIRDALTKNGLSIVQTTDITDKGLILDTTLLHSSGQWMCSSYPVDPIKKDPQGYGSALSYARRYSLAAMIGLAQADDDANEASKTTYQPRPVQNHAPQTQGESLAQLRAKSAVLMEKLNTETEKSTENVYKNAEETVATMLDKGPEKIRPQLSSKQAGLLKATCKNKNIPWGAVRGYVKNRFLIDDPLEMDTKQFNEFLNDANNNAVSAQ